jgi:hypothetical protein
MPSCVNYKHFVASFCRMQWRGRNGLIFGAKSVEGLVN